MPRAWSVDLAERLGRRLFTYALFGLIFAAGLLPGRPSLPKGRADAEQR